MKAHFSIRRPYGWFVPGAALLSLALLAAGCSTPEPDPTPLATGRAVQSAPEATGTRYMVATANPDASEAALAILRRGGSAVDAAVAAQAVLGLVEPQSSGIGGGAFLLHWNGTTHKLSALDGRETAPMSAEPRLFLDETGKPLDFRPAALGARSVGVPGVLRMLELAHREHGKLPWAQLFAPAIRLAEAGFPVSPRLAESIAADDHLAKMPETARYFFDANGKPLAAGTPLRNPELAAALRAIAQGGADAFYSGKIAQDIVAAVNNA